MAKNKNQNRQRDQRPQAQDPAMEPQEHTRSTMPEEHGMTSPTQVSRKQQKRFGHN